MQTLQNLYIPISTLSNDGAAPVAAWGPLGVDGSLRVMKVLHKVIRCQLLSRFVCKVYTWCAVWGTHEGSWRLPGPWTS